MPKVVFIGGGNYIFGRDFISDILSYPNFEDITLTLMDVDKGRLDISTAYARRLAKQLGVNLLIESTTDRRAALDGADYVLNSFRSGVGRLLLRTGKLR